MEQLVHARLNQEKIRERVSEYIANRGYVKERTFTLERLGLDEFYSPGPSDYIQNNTFWANMNILGNLELLFKPVKEVYQKGKDLYKKVSVLTPRCHEFVLRREALKKEAEEDPGFLRWKRIYLRFLNIDNNIAFCTPDKVSYEESMEALEELYSLLQEDKNGIIRTALPRGDASNIEVMLHGIKEDLYKIKNHTSIVCLDQLKKDGLKLDEGVSTELGRIPREYLDDAYSWNEHVSLLFRLRNGWCSFGDGLFESDIQRG